MPEPARFRSALQAPASSRGLRKTAALELTRAEDYLEVARGTGLRETAPPCRSPADTPCGNAFEGRGTQSKSEGPTSRSNRGGRCVAAGLAPRRDNRRRENRTRREDRPERWRICPILRGPESTHHGRHARPRPRAPVAGR